MWCADTKKSNEVEIVREHAQHMLRLIAVKSRIETNPPKTMLHLKKKLKKRTQDIEEKQSIQKDNQNLLKKMFEIDSRPHKNKPLSRTSSHKSLNKSFRIQQLTQITEENQNLLTRLQKTKSSYSFQKWDQDHKYKQYLAFKVSENSKRIPKIASFGFTTAISFTGKIPTRPTTTSEKHVRPMTAVMGKRKSDNKMLL